MRFTSHYGGRRSKLGPRSFDLGKVSLISRFSGVLHLLLFIAGVQETNK